MRQALAAPPPPPPSANSVGVAGAIRLDQARALAKYKDRLSAQWSIASVVGPYEGGSSPMIGRVERSLDGGKTWQELHVDDHVSFRAVAAEGAEVWAGGSRGALYHSTDGGQHWTRVSVVSGQGTVTDAIVSIGIIGQERVSVTTVARETWVTTDGGQLWTKQ
jgi:Photosynthesis system II assembly factor YCF48